MLEKLLNILALFGRRSPLTALEVVEQSGYPQSSVYRLLKTLRTAGFLTHTPEGFVPGPTLMEIATRGRDDFDIIAYSREEMVSLCRQIGETVLLSALSGDETVAVDVVHADQPIRFAFEVGMRRPPHAGASSKILFASMSEARQGHLLETARFEMRTPATVTDPALLRRELKLVREQGYHVTVGEWEEGVLSIAAPIRCAFGVWGVSIVGLAFRFDDQRVAECIRLVLETARRIEARIESRTADRAAERHETGKSL